MMSLDRSPGRLAKNRRQILPDDARLQAALENPDLAAQAEAALAVLPPPVPLPLSEHHLAAGWLRRQNTSSQRAVLWGVACLSVVLSAGLVFWRLGHKPQTSAPLACLYRISHRKSLALPLNNPVQQDVLVEGSAGEMLEFPIDPDRAPMPPVEALTFLMQDNHFRQADALLQPQRRAPNGASFFVEQHVDLLLRQGALRAGDNHLYIAVGRPAALPRTGQALEQALSSPHLGEPAQRRTWQLIHVLARISGRSS